MGMWTFILQVFQFSVRLDIFLTKRWEKRKCLCALECALKKKISVCFTHFMHVFFLSPPKTRSE